MNCLRFISVLFLLTVSGICARSQIRILPREKVENAAAPRLASDSASFVFDTRHIVAEPMNEDDMPKTFRYVLRNDGGCDIRIKRLVTTCSCASASIDRMTVAPGETASVSVRYTPEGHPGRFERRIFIYSEGNDDPSAVLRLTVDVGNGADLSDDWPVQMGMIRLRRSEVTFKAGQKAVEMLRCVNAGDKAVRIGCEHLFLPGCLSFKAEPEELEPGDEGQIIIMYDPSKGESREREKVILKGLGVPPGQSSIDVRIK